MTVSRFLPPGPTPSDGVNRFIPKALPTPPRLPAAVPRSGISGEARLALHQLLADYQRSLALAFDAGASATALCMARSNLVQRVIEHLWVAFLGDIPGLSLYALGGFGHGLLYPASDVDLLVLSQGKPVSGKRGLESLFAIIWDIGLAPGHAVHEVDTCRVLARKDQSVFTSLLDARRIAGDVGMDKRLAEVVDDVGMWPPEIFLAAKREEQARRYRRAGDSTFRLEPDLKDGPGGLRDLDMLRWLGSKVFRDGAYACWTKEGLLDTREGEALDHAGEVLARVRYALHLEAGRREERLLFDYQRALAERLGYHDSPAGGLGVEQFMQAYYRSAATIERLSDEALRRLADHLQPPPPAESLDHDFQRRGTTVEPRSAELFIQRPAALLEIGMHIGAANGITGLSPTARRWMRQALRQNAELAEDSEALVAFRQLLQRAEQAVPALVALARQGVLAALIPAFAGVSGRMQYDLFHIYTVDQHTLRVLAQMARFAGSDTAQELPLAVGIWNRLESPELLLLAGLFHDVAKGRGGDHSVLGEDEARRFAQRLGLDDDAVEQVAWLVRWHLLMSTTAQRQDIGDPKVVRVFSERVGDTDHLDMLYLLTVADIIATSPKLWNGFKDRLLADLYLAARYRLRGEGEVPEHAEERAAHCRAIALERLVAGGLDPATVLSIWEGLPMALFLRHRPEQVVWQTRTLLAADGRMPWVAVLAQSVRGGSEMLILAADRDGLFAQVTSVLDRLGFLVREARILGAGVGRAIDSFVLLDAATQAPASAKRAESLRAALQSALQSETRPRRPKRVLSRRLRHFQRSPRLAYTTTADGERTRLALVVSNRPGLLAAVAEAFLEAEVRVHDARIATYGERVEDFFELTNRSNQLLNEGHMRALEKAIYARLDPKISSSKRGNHVCT